MKYKKGWPAKWRKHVRRLKVGGVLQQVLCIPLDKITCFHGCWEDNNELIVVNRHEYGEKEKGGG